MKKNYWDAIKERRTFYALGKEPVASDERIHEIVGQAVQYVPSSFNSQSSRVLILLGPQHDRLWDLTKQELKKIVPPESFAATEQKLDSAFRSGYGSILYFEDTAVVQGLQEQYPAYSDNFPVWAEQSSGMLQFAVWTALEAEGWGASLQHYNPVIDSAVQEEWSVPASWKLVAQMPFGSPEAEPAPKEYQPIAARVKMYR
ncbi:nitroreductase family protein [Geomonas anaerohicana]|uniref:Nitroreductase family protein n=1 Tax=Geomonas anaerohicana TaxID=2798583 RepID=A0ABS0YHS7_9BACT|nr:nitroreductase family protein [Geomonas anaerohicana]MBJ6751855.1 nitroreductase family protein [Geomonas anaerohicana]